MTAASDDNLHDKVLAELDQTQKQVNQLTQELKEVKAKLHQLVYRDGLSGLYNHRYFHEMINKELERSIRYAAPFSLIIFDIDILEELNKTCSPENGELILMNVARIVESEVRPTDIAARYSGENFALILPETNLNGVRTFARRLCQSVHEMATIIDGKEVKTTISIGGATFVPGATKATKDDLLQAVEKALSDARKNGPNQIEVVQLT
ncbi:MAG TPA: GGDEF domain-containing protein [Geopsychrobacteraceae bacterium]|nr:GGDEF domain-containing protein [Geopsychrobacteraceae bacterium]